MEKFKTLKEKTYWVLFISVMGTLLVVLESLGLIK